MSPLERCVWAAAYVQRMDLEIRRGTPRGIRAEGSIWQADAAVRELREAFAVDGRTEDPTDAGRGTSGPTPPAGPEDAASPAPKRQ